MFGGGTEHEYVSILKWNLHQFSPQMEINSFDSQLGLQDTIARLVEAQHVICGPGTGMVCLFPALSRKDCLNYGLPGPIDWWSHLFYSHLEDVAAAENAYRHR